MAIDPTANDAKEGIDLPVPVAPVAPVTPVDPRWPAGPAGPAGPIGPGGPAACAWSVIELNIAKNAKMILFIIVSSSGYPINPDACKIPQKCRKTNSFDVP